MKMIQIECEFDLQSKLKRKIGAIMGATRQYDMACMTGYRSLDKRYGCIVNIVFRLVDKIKKCQMIEIAFK